MPDRTLTPNEINRALLTRQHLLTRTHHDLTTTVEEVGGLQTQYSPSAYTGLWSRMTTFRKSDLTEALTSGEIIQSWAMRCTIHMVSAADHPRLTEAVREHRRQLWHRTTKIDADMDAVADTVRQALQDGPRTQAELVRAIDGAGHPKEAFSGAQLWIDLVRVPPAGTWDRPRAHVYGLAAPPPAPVDREQAEEHLARRYLGGFGPATPGDLARYAGWSITFTKGVLARLALRTFRDPDGAALVDLPDAPLPDADVPAPVRFLGTWDAVLLLGHAVRARLLPSEHRHHVFHTRKPQSAPTFLVDGRVAGTWRRADDRIGITPFEPLTPAAREEVEAEAGRLAAFHVSG